MSPQKLLQIQIRGRKSEMPCTPEPCGYLLDTDYAYGALADLVPPPGFMVVTMTPRSTRTEGRLSEAMSRSLIETPPSTIPKSIRFGR